MRQLLRLPANASAARSTSLVRETCSRKHQKRGLSSKNGLPFLVRRSIESVFSSNFLCPHHYQHAMIVFPEKKKKKKQPGGATCTNHLSLTIYINGSTFCRKSLLSGIGNVGCLLRQYKILPRSLSLRNLVLGYIIPGILYECGSWTHPLKGCNQLACLRDSAVMVGWHAAAAVWLVEDGVHSVRLFRTSSNLMREIGRGHCRGKSGRAPQHLQAYRGTIYRRVSKRQFRRGWKEARSWTSQGSVEPLCDSDSENQRREPGSF